MLKSHEKFHSANGKRLVLVADDEWINRELLRNLLREDYEVIEAEDGEQALAQMHRYQDTLSLVLLDLSIAKLHGMKVLEQVKQDEELRRIPIMSITADQQSEIDSLAAGASDFIPCPYPPPGVVLARVRRSIELSEDRQIINSTERDPLTGLYNREYFYRYAEQFDHYHKELEMDAFVVDIYHFRTINERFGNAYGDAILRRVGNRLRDMVKDVGGIVCRREADTFMVYCPHGKDYRAILENASVGLNEEDSINSRVRLRMGVYARVDKTLDIERRFDRAKMACDTIGNRFSSNIGLYDSSLHEKELYAEQLIEDFPTAIREKQFQVYYQPKFNIQGEQPFLTSAEALVRWQHPRLGMISPGVFIPLFEENGLIPQLDRYVWDETARQIREWKDRLGFAVPVSVNVSRVDMYDPHLVDTFRILMAEYGLTPEMYLLEITESAYTGDSDQIIETVNQLRRLGFRIEMDDFGTGYSSLNMISTLPIDALKLDMLFIRTAFSEQRDTKLLEVIIDIADYLSVPVIAEGVETREQLEALQLMGCDIAQGYYFSKPIPAAEFERFVIDRREQARHEQEEEEEQLLHLLPKRKEIAFAKIAHALCAGYDTIYYIDSENDHYVVFTVDDGPENLHIKSSGAHFFNEAERDVNRFVDERDRERMRRCLDKQTLLSRLENGQVFFTLYHRLVDGVPVYYHLKAVNAGTEDDHHIVIGVGDARSHSDLIE